ncbi:phosphoadenosine phosphosulfate reductase family protein [Hahella aquimaris]|uniref:phosphoadenosine phosphosulfate reductase family protein n=1 Tax=Hahella sp. HNIBRBA332 TaxID=3015983 RepID=UPI00273BC1C9|nr:phosphoadenosine phosphosulfate reductase family protein [Hahella sp. HNIBRBA332]WLQ15388.1 phosphoadenosine phosphosulfate reductase family protein [Hahella sp. HNIBRBA332]
MKELNVVSVSGGKDSTALALLAIEEGAPNLEFVFADTGHEHQTTYDYVDYLDKELKRLCGKGITRVKADFAAQIAGKRRYVQKKWLKEFMGEDRSNRSRRKAKRRIYQALKAIKPTGNPFLDLCIWKGRFPSTRARFCSQELKHVPVDEYINKLRKEHGYQRVVHWQGVRRDESRARANLDEWELNFGDIESGAGFWTYRPLLDWKAEDCFAMHTKYGIKWNPLYEQGMGRVGCMPCIHAGKRELFEISRRFPHVPQTIDAWEKRVSSASKRGMSTFFAAGKTPGAHKKDSRIKMPNIYDVIEWSKTGRGGNQYDLISAINLDSTPTCSSIYGLCE